MCNIVIALCFSCTRRMRKESSCRDFDVYKDGKGYKSIYDNDWMIEHVQKNLAGLRVDVKFTFCLTCTCKITDKAKFRPDAKKVSVAVVESTKDCLGNFTAILPDETTLNQWIKPQFVEMDTEKSLRKMATFRGESPESMAVVSSIKATLQMMSRSITDLETQLDAISEDFNHSTKSIAETSSAETKSILTRDVKTKIILAMQDEKEEQERALEQIEDCDEETRSCIECSKPVTVKCFRQKHFHWCTSHARMTDESGVCPKYTATFQCNEIECDKSENEAWWEEMQENAILGGPGFRE